MRHRRTSLNSRHFWVERAQAHRAGKALDRIFVFASADSKEAAEKPGCRQIWIERQRLVDQRDAAIEVAGQMRECMAAPGKSDRIVIAQLRGALRQPGAFGHLVRAIIHPAMELAPEVAPCRHCVSRCEIRIELYRLVKQAQRLADEFSGAPMKARHAAQ